jgi:hypothetical protein
MRIAAFGMIALVSFAASAQAQESPKTQNDIVIGSGTSSQPAAEGPCVEVEIGGDKASPLNCLNQKLKKQVDQVQPSVNLPPVDAKSQDIRVGVFNRAGVQQQYGSNFGVSVVPQRPAPSVFVGAGHR